MVKNGGATMIPFNETILEFRKQLTKGVIQQAYKGLLEFMLSLKADLQKRHPELGVSGGFYEGYLDMCYFACFPTVLKERKLKIAVVFNFTDFRFEGWLSAVNKQVLAEYWNLIKQSEWNKYHLVPSLEGMDSALEYVLAEDPDFSDLDGLSQKLEQGTLQFTRDVEEFLRKNAL
jgi:hypothetical protein